MKHVVSLLLVLLMGLSISCGGGSSIQTPSNVPQAVTVGHQGIYDQYPVYGQFGKTAEISWCYHFPANFYDLEFHVGDTDDSFAYRIRAPHASKHNSEFEIMKFVDGEWSDNWTQDMGIPLNCDIDIDLGGLPLDSAQYRGCFTIDDSNAFPEQRYYVEVVNVKTGKTSEKFWFPDYSEEN